MRLDVAEKGDETRGNVGVHGHHFSSKSLESNVKEVSETVVFCQSWVPVKQNLLKVTTVQTGFCREVYLETHLFDKEKKN